jgi:hypothetical protein
VFLDPCKQTQHPQQPKAITTTIVNRCLVRVHGMAGCINGGHRRTQHKKLGGGHFFGTPRRQPFLHIPSSPTRGRHPWSTPHACSSLHDVPRLAQAGAMRITRGDAGGMSTRQRSSMARIGLRMSPCLGFSGRTRPTRTPLTNDHAIERAFIWDHLAGDGSLSRTIRPTGGKDPCTHVFGRLTGACVHLACMHVHTCAVRSCMHAPTRTPPR